MLVSGTSIVGVIVSTGKPACSSCVVQHQQPTNTISLSVDTSRGTARLPIHPSLSSFSHVQDSNSHLLSPLDQSMCLIYPPIPPLLPCPPPHFCPCKLFYTCLSSPPSRDWLLRSVNFPFWSILRNRGRAGVDTSRVCPLTIVPKEWI